MANINKKEEYNLTTPFKYSDLSRYLFPYSFSGRSKNVKLLMEHLGGKYSYMYAFIVYSLKPSSDIEKALIVDFGYDPLEILPKSRVRYKAIKQYVELGVLVKVKDHKNCRKYYVNPNFFNALSSNQRRVYAKIDNIFKQQ